MLKYKCKGEAGEYGTWIKCEKKTHSNRSYTRMGSVSIYIWASTTFINEMNYRKRAYAIENYAKNIIDWENAKVNLVKLEKEPCNTPQIFSAKINRYLLSINGGYAVKVEMRTDMDALLGPSILYFNPFTKQCIGGVIRM